MVNKDAIRILHIVGGMNRGGVETWLMHVLRNIDRKRFKLDFLVHTNQTCAYDEEIHRLGSNIIPCLHPSRPLAYAHNFKRILRDHGPYDVVHSHVHHYSGWILRLANQVGVHTRVAHSHSDTSAVNSKAKLTRRIYLSLMKRWIANHATLGLAASGQAAAALFGPGWETDHLRQLSYYAIDLVPFHDATDSVAVRSALDMPKNAFVIGHVGRFNRMKNHVFMLDVAVEVIKRESLSRFLFVGDGPLRSEIEHRAAKMNLSENFVFTGVRTDVPQLLVGAMDVFLFPSLYEGLPVTVLEAQAAGLPIILSDTITPEVSVVPGLLKWLSLSQPAAVWADSILTARDVSLNIPQSKALAYIERSPFNILNGVKALELIYSTGLHGC